MWRSYTGLIKTDDFRLPLKVGIDVKKASEMENFDVPRWTEKRTGLRNTQARSIVQSYKPDSIAWIALAFASSRAVTHCCRSTSVDALMWKVCVPPLLTTKVQASTVCIKAPCKEIVPRQVWDISAGFLKQGVTETQQSQVRVPLRSAPGLPNDTEKDRREFATVCNIGRDGLDF